MSLILNRELVSAGSWNAAIIFARKSSSSSLFAGVEPQGSGITIYARDQFIINFLKQERLNYTEVFEEVLTQAITMNVNKSTLDNFIADTNSNSATFQNYLGFGCNLYATLDATIIQFLWKNVLLLFT